MKEFLFSFSILGLVAFYFSTNTTTALDANPSVEYAEKIDWVKLDDLEKLIQKNPKKTIVDVYTPWCGPCRRMDQKTFTNKEIIKIMSDDFYSVKFNAEGPDEIQFQGKKWTNPKYDSTRGTRRNYPHQLSSFFAVRGYPCLVVLDENMKVVDKILGYKTPAQLKAALKKHR